MFRLFQLSNDSFHFLLTWLDLVCLCKLDIAIGNAYERSLWLHSLRTMDSKAVDEYEHIHDSIRWLISRGASATRIRIRGTSHARDRITDQTFAGLRMYSTSKTDTDDRNYNLNNVGAGTLKSHSTVRDRLRNRDITTQRSTCASVKLQDCRDLVSINLSYCDRISDIGISTLAVCCPLLISIDLSNCHRISNIGVSAIAEGCHHLTSINLSNCCRISDIGVSALAQGCPLLTSIGLSGCHSISVIGLSALAEGCPSLTSIDLRGRSSLSDIGVSALAEGCHHLTSIDFSYGPGVSVAFFSTFRLTYPHLNA